MPEYGSKDGFLLLLRVLLGTFGVLQRAPEGIGRKSTPSESSQRVYERMLEKLQTLKISRNYKVSSSIWLKTFFDGFFDRLGVISGTFGVLPWALRGFVEEALLLILLRGSMRDC